MDHVEKMRENILKTGRITPTIFVRSGLLRIHHRISLNHEKLSPGYVEESIEGKIPPVARHGYSMEYVVLELQSIMRVMYPMEVVHFVDMEIHLHQIQLFHESTRQ